MNDFCRPEQIKSLCDYLISPMGKFTVGANFVVDGDVLNENNFTMITGAGGFLGFIILKQYCLGIFND